MHKKTRPNKMTYQRNFPVRNIGKNVLALDNINLVRSLSCLIFPIKKKLVDCFLNTQIINLKHILGSYTYYVICEFVSNHF